MKTDSLVKFKANTEPCIVYVVENGTPIMEYDEVFNKYMECIELKVLGLVPKVLLTEAKNHPENIPAIDVAVQISILKNV